MGENRTNGFNAKLQILAYLAVIVVCAVILGEKLTIYAMAPPGAVEKGDQFETLQAVVPANAEHALVLALSPTCSYCTKSMPYFERLTKQRNEQRSSVAIVAGIHQTQELDDEQAVLDQHDVAVDKLLHLDMEKINIPSVPTTLLVDKQGKVLEVWRGEVNEDRLEEMIRRL